MKRAIGILVIWVFLVTSCSTNRSLDNPFYAFNTSMSLPNAPEPFGGKIKIIKELGYDGLGSDSNYYFEHKKAMDSLNFSIPEVYHLLNIDKSEDGSTEAPIDARLKAIIEDLKGSSTIISLSLISKSKQKIKVKNADDYVVERLQLLADYAEKYDVQLSVYPHVNMYCESIAHTVKIVKMVNRPNLGMSFNLCHFLKVEGSENYQDKLKMALPYLKMVSISGADEGDTRMMSWKRLIQTLGEGSFDTYRFVKNLKDMGYDGRIGLQCFGIKDDFEDSLNKAMNTWKKYQIQYSQPAKADY
jgi:sugar phosphate isomerase/epimerase